MSAPALAARLLHGALAAWAAPAARRFSQALDQPERAQRARLRTVLDAVRGTRLGRRLGGLERVRTAREYQDAVPLAGEREQLGDLEAIAAGEPAVWTRAPVLRLEPTGGTTGPARLVPYTAGLLAEFHAALAPWLADLHARRPALRRGPVYWSVSPLARRLARTPGGLAVGSPGETSYFPRPLAPLLTRLLAVPEPVSELPDVESARYVTLRLLVEREDLTMASVWNPSFLTLLFDDAERHAERLLTDLARGVCRPEASADGEREDRVRAIVERLSFRARPGRAARLRAALAGREGTPAAILWPRLALLSLWTDAHAALALPEVRRRLPGVEIQGKGLLATEGVTTLPLFEAPAPVLALRSHFYEFLEPERPERRPRLAHEVEDGAEYEVVLSTGGGLLRHRTGDRVRVAGHHRRAPCLRFLGRGAGTSDRVGEKLAPDWVERVLARVLPAALAGAGTRFAMLAPEDGAPPAYRLFLECEAGDGALAGAAGAVEDALREAPAYRYARELGQLGPVRARRVRDAARRYEARAVGAGQRAGDLKPRALHPETGWEAHLQAVEVEPESAGVRSPAAFAAESR